MRSMNRLDLEGRNVVVTGGGSGIGEAIVNRLCASGATALVWDVHQAHVDRLIALNDPQRFALALDVTDPKAVDQAMVLSLDWIRQHNRSASSESGVDAMICSAGIAGPNQPVTDYRF
ncbi:MAG: SDR family NAD(P)-dependent oxidoreductase, partial [Betaproteobacteria bacterium]|nr:SDR family NAD(P)-dependent oxidoreductase [Betaproteobacteria bacterium]